MQTLPLVSPEADDLLQFLVRYKIADVREAALDGFGPGGYVSADLTNVHLNHERGSKSISVRVSAPLTIYT
jgi:hypothetical protein